MTPPSDPRPQATHASAIALLLLSAALWSMGGLLIKSVAWDAPAIAGTRSAIAALTIAIWCRGRLHFTWSRWQLAGAAAYAATVMLFVWANKLTTAANAILLQYTAPVWVGLVAPHLLGERCRPRDWWVVAVTLPGMALFFVDGLSPSGLWGNLVAIASGVAFAAMTLCLRKQKDGSAIESIVLGNVLAALAGLPFIHGPFPDARGWGCLALLGVVQLGFSYIAYAAAVRRATAMEAALVPMLEPVLNPIWVLLAMGETPGPWALAGGAVVLGAVGFRTAAALRERVAPAPS